MGFEVIWAVHYECDYKMHYDRFAEVQTNKICFRSGPNIAIFHTIQFTQYASERTSSPARITPWHGVWEYHDIKQEWHASFNPNWPEDQTLNLTILNRNGPAVWRGSDQKNSIEMVLKLVGYYCLPARNWLYYDVLPNGEMIVRPSES